MKIYPYLLIIVILASSANFIAIESNITALADDFTEAKIANPNSIRRIDTTPSVNENSAEASTAIQIDTILTDPGVIRILLIDVADGKEILYGLPGMDVKVAVLVKGPFDNRDLKVELKRDIALAPDIVLGDASFSGITMLDDETAWFNITSLTLDADYALFGFGSGQIRNYYVQFIDTTPLIDDVLFRGGDEADGGTGTGILYMRGQLVLESIEYYNVTATSYIPIKISEGDWTLTSEVYLRIIEGPLWDFSVYVNFKYDVKYAVDDAIVTDQVIALFTLADDGVFLPGEYIYTPIDTNQDPAFLYIEPTRPYGTGLGQTSTIYGLLQEGDEVGSNLVDVEFLYDRSYASIGVRSNLANLPPQVNIISPTDGDTISESIFHVYASIEDPNSNYLIESILLNGVEVISDYDPLTGELDTIYNAGTIESKIISLELEAYDDKGEKGQDTVYVQTYNPLGFLPSDYDYVQKDLVDNLYDEIFIFNYLFNYTSGDDLFIELVPILEIGISIDHILEAYIATPDSIEGGETGIIYSVVSDPMILTQMNISLDLAFNFGYGDLSFSGMTNLYFDEFTKEWITELGIFTFTLEDLIGRDRADSLTHFELKASDFLPGILGWLADIVLNLDIINVFKQINTASFDVDVVGGTASVDSMTFSRSQVKIFTVTPDIGATETHLSFSNYETSYQFGVEIYFQFTLTGSIAGFTIGSINLNEWIESNLGIIIPYVDLWFSALTITYSGILESSITVTNRPTSASMVSFIRGDTSQKIQINYTSYGEAIAGAVVTGEFKGTVYTATDLGAGIYEFDIPNHSGLETLDIVITKLGYQVQILSIELESPTVDYTETTTKISIETTTEISTQTDVSTFTETKTDAPINLAGPLIALFSITTMVILIRRRN